MISGGPSAVHKGQKDLSRLIYTSSGHCIRQLISQYCDGGVGLTCLQIPHSQICNRCQAVNTPNLSAEVHSHHAQILQQTGGSRSHTHSNVFQHAMNISNSKRSTGVLKTDTYAEDLLRLLQQYSSQCSYCYVVSRRRVEQHDIMHCLTLRAQQLDKAYIKFRQMIIYKS